MVDLRQLRTLRAVADHGTISAAAHALHLTPSAVSQQLAMLSKSTGCELLKRRGRGVALTDAARVLVSHADAVFALLERAASEMRTQSAPVTLRIGGFPTAIAGIVAPAMRTLRREHPGWRFEVRDTESEESLARLLDSTMDLAVVMAAPNRPLLGDPRLRVEPLLEEEYYAALPCGHPFASTDAVALTDLAADSWILAREGMSCHDHVSAICADTGFQPRGNHRATDFGAALALIAAGCGVTLLPRLGIPPQLPEGVILVPLRDASPRRYCLLAMRAGADYPEVTSALRRAAARFTTR
ncbi:MAG TPA: LysR family transcriptional regulator [Streptosporangiaceae bacterium]|nr:LysR family transcriptional regulator [Streptosporangiaceae bacterium]